MFVCVKSRTCKIFFGFFLKCVDEIFEKNFSVSLKGFFEKKKK